MVKCVSCGHEEKYHAVIEFHVLGTSHCTVLGCDCKGFVSPGIPGKKAKKKTERVILVDEVPNYL